MARESQGLQISLIIFVMLTIVLGVCLYIYVQKADEALKATKAAEERAQQANNEKAAKDAECTQLKTMIGMAEKTTGDIEAQFKADMEKYGASFPTESRFYSPMIDRLWKAAQTANEEWNKQRVLVVALEEKFKTREAAKSAQIDQFTQQFGSLEQRVAKIKEEYDATRSTTLAETNRIAETLTRVKTAANNETAAAKKEVVAANAAVRKAETETRQANEVIQKLNKLDMDVPCGEITWVNAATRTCWINRGRADALQRQTKFTVFPADTNDAAKTKAKGTVEVTRIVGDHAAEVRILDDKLADPILPKDRIYTPLWSPGQQNHFALAGFMNIDGDGRNALSTVRSLITMYGGVVDCELDDQGNRQGQITAQTQYLVLGEPPKDKSSKTLIENYGAMLRDAERYSVKTMSLSEFKQKMNYQKSSSTEQSGGGR